jgi:hypothetical protein
MNNTRIRKITSVLLMVFLSTLFAQAQNVAHKHTSPAKKAYTDSLSKIPYDYTLPILGEKLRKMGFDLPYPNGLMINYIVGSQFITLSDLAVGLDSDPSTYTNVDGIARFSSIEPFVNVINFRYDVWLLPFLNVYALGGFVNSKTDVNLGLPFEAQFNAANKGPMVGWGLAVAGGVGPIFATADYNMAWTFIPNLVGASVANVFDIRVGHVFNFNKKPKSNISLMVGAQWLKLNSASQGKADLTKMFGGDGSKKANALDDLNNWYGDLPESKQEEFGNIYDKLEGWLSNDGGDSYIYYTFSKKLFYPWSMTTGLNYQINKRYTVMALATYLGSRKQMVLSFNYRFGHKGKTLLSGVEF